MTDAVTGAAQGNHVEQVFWLVAVMMKDGSGFTAVVTFTSRGGGKLAASYRCMNSVLGGFDVRLASDPLAQFNAMGLLVPFFFPSDHNRVPFGMPADAQLGAFFADV